VLFVIALTFWPLFMLLTIIEERAGLSWLRTGKPTVWVPIAILALLSAVVAPLLLRVSVPKKIVAVICSLLGFALTLGGVFVIGITFFNWDD
jgi:hypothetical protein